MSATGPRQRASGVSTVSMLVVGDVWRRNGTMRFMRIDDIDRGRRTVGGTFSDDAIITVSFTDLRRYYTRVR